MSENKDDNDENFWEAKEISTSSSNSIKIEQVEEFVWGDESQENELNGSEDYLDAETEEKEINNANTEIKEREVLLENNKTDPVEFLQLNQANENEEVLENISREISNKKIDCLARENVNATNIDIKDVVSDTNQEYDNAQNHEQIPPEIILHSANDKNLTYKIRLEETVNNKVKTLQSEASKTDCALPTTNLESLFHDEDDFEFTDAFVSLSKKNHDDRKEGKMIKTQKTYTGCAVDDFCYLPEDNDAYYKQSDKETICNREEDLFACKSQEKETTAVLDNIIKNLQHIVESTNFLQPHTCNTTGVETRENQKIDNQEFNEGRSDKKIKNQNESYTKNESSYKIGNDVNEEPPSAYADNNATTLIQTKKNSEVLHNIAEYQHLDVTTVHSIAENCSISASKTVNKHKNLNSTFSDFQIENNKNELKKEIFAEANTGLDVSGRINPMHEFKTNDGSKIGNTTGTGYIEEEEEKSECGTNYANTYKPSPIKECEEDKVGDSFPNTCTLEDDTKNVDFWSDDGEEIFESLIQAKQTRTETQTELINERKGLLDKGHINVFDYPNLDPDPVVSKQSGSEILPAHVGKVQKTETITIKSVNAMEAKSSHSYIENLVETMEVTEKLVLNAKNSQYKHKSADLKIPASPCNFEKTKTNPANYPGDVKSVFTRTKKIQKGASKSKICFVENKVIHSRVVEQSRVCIDTQITNILITAHSTYYLNPEEKLYKLKESITEAEKSIKNLIYASPEKIKRSLAESTEYRIERKTNIIQLNNNVDFFPTQLTYESASHCVSEYIASNNWLMALLLSNADPNLRNETIVRFLDIVYTEESVPIILIRFGMYKEALEKLKKHSSNFDQCLSIALTNYNKEFVQEIIQVIAKHNKLNALRAYVIVSKLYDIDISADLFVNNFFALEILDILAKSKNIKNIDILRYNYIKYFVNYDKDAAYKYYTKFKTTLHKVYQAELNEAFAEKKWNFSGFRKVVDIGIGKIIGVEIETKANQNDDISKNQSDTGADSKKEFSADLKSIEIEEDKRVVNDKRPCSSKFKTVLCASDNEANKVINQKIVTNSKKQNYGDLYRGRSDNDLDNACDDTTHFKQSENKLHSTGSYFQEMTVQAPNQDIERNTTSDGTHTNIIVSNTKDSDKKCTAESVNIDTQIVEDRDQSVSPSQSKQIPRKSLYKNQEHAQSYADFFDNDNSGGLEGKKSTDQLISQFTKDDSDIVDNTKKTEEPKQEKSSFFSLSRFFGTKERTFKAKIESDAAFVYDPVTKQWVNKNSNNKTPFDYSSYKKEKTKPKKSESFASKESTTGLSGRYTGMKRSNHSVVDLIPGVKKNNK